MAQTTSGDKSVHGYLIDPESRTIEAQRYKGDFRQIYELIDARRFDLARFGEHGDGVYVDDEGLLCNPEHFFTINGFPDPLPGKGFVLGVDGTGESASPHISVERLRQNVTFFTRLNDRGSRGFRYQALNPSFGVLADLIDMPIAARVL